MKLCTNVSLNFWCLRMTMFYENRLGYQLATRANASVGLDEENSFNDITY